MVTRAQIERLKARVEALAPPPRPPSAGAREQFLQRLEGIASRLRTAAAASGEEWPPPMSPDERAAAVSRFREFLSTRRISAVRRTTC